MAANPIEASQGRNKRARARKPPAQTSSRGPNWGRLVSEGRAARAGADAGRWRIGHLSSLVAKQYGARSVQAFADDIGESYSTVRRYRWVFTRYEPTVRFRFQQLSFSHFQAVAGLTDRVKWLDRAETGCWSVDELVRQSRGVGSTSPPTPGPVAAGDVAAPIKQARAHLRRLASLDDRSLARTWASIEPFLDQLSGEIDRIRDRMRSVRGVRLGRYRAGSTGNGHRARTRA